MKHDVKILELKADSTSLAVADPGIVIAVAGDLIEFTNLTGDDATLFIAEDGVLETVQPSVGTILRRGEHQPYGVLPFPGTHEYQVRVTLSNRRQVFAIGASTPRIIIRSATEVA